MVGIKARVVAPPLGAERRVGVIESVRGDTVQFRRAEGVTSLAPSDITTMEVLTGTHRETGKWAGIGFLVGAVGGAAIGVLTHKRPDPYCTPSFGCIERPDRKSVDGAAGALIGLLGGSVIGGIYGHHLRETWTEFPVPPRK
jgi:outer membrane lipoprotein SlyB